MLEAQKIKGQIFMGCGEHSMAQCYHLHRELDRAFEILGGIQQPPSIHESKEACDQHRWDCRRGDTDVESIARRIFLGLTGKWPTEVKDLEDLKKELNIEEV